MNKKTLLVVAVATVLGAGTCFARPGPGGGRPGGHRPPPARHHGGGHHGGGHHHRGGSFWGRGGRNFLPGFIGGVVGGALIGNRTTYVNTSPVVVTPAPVVVSPAPVVVPAPTPVYTTQNVWVEGRYIDQVQPNGTVIRVWQPGHYEQRQVIVQ